MVRLCSAKVILGSFMNAVVKVGSGFFFLFVCLYFLLVLAIDSVWNLMTILIKMAS